MSLEDLENLRKKLITGDNKALKEIFVTYREDSISFLRSKNVTDDDLASDHYTDAIMVLRDNIISGKLKEISSIKNYILTICLNLARNERYIERRRSKKESDVRLLLYEDNHNVNESNSIKTERIKVCKAAMKTLSDRCQKILVLYYVHKLRMKEIALELELASGDVAKTLKSRCYKSWMKATKTINL